jgi:hypothetical protein
MDVVLSAAATWSLADGCRAFLLVDALPPRLHPPFVGNLCMDIFLLVGIVRWVVEVEVPPPPLVFLLFVLLFFISWIPQVILGLLVNPL